jgi:hypothetical protein
MNPHDFSFMSRRQFCGGVVKSALLLALAGGWRSQLLASTGPGATSYALNPLALHGGPLGSPAPVQGPFGEWAYRWVFNSLSKDTESIKISDIGTLQIRRTVSGDRVKYVVSQKRSFGNYESTLVCAARGGEPLIEWTTRQETTRKDEAPLVSEVAGKVEGAVLKITRGEIGDATTLDGPLIPEVSLLANPSCLPPLAEGGFSLLEGGAMVRSNIRVRRDPEADTTLDGVTASAWLLTGTGLLPTHLMVDGEGRVLCRTMFTTSLILDNIAS